MFNFNIKIKISFSSHLSGIKRLPTPKEKKGFILLLRYEANLITKDFKRQTPQKQRVLDLNQSLLGMSQSRKHSSNSHNCGLNRNRSSIRGNYKIYRGLLAHAIFELSVYRVKGGRPYPQTNERKGNLAIVLVVYKLPNTNYFHWLISGGFCYLLLMRF